MNISSWFHQVFTNSTQRLYLVGMVLVLLLTILVTGYKLGSIPHGLTWDEAAIGYNGYAVLTTRRDEWLVRLPISFRSFGDYKAPLAIYINGVSTALFGLNPFGIRLPFMVAGVLSVLGFMLIVELLWRDQKNSYLYSVTAGFLMATTPWFVHYSRTGFESGLALFFIIWAVYFFLLFKKYQTSLPIVLSVVFFVLSLYTYHSSKVVVPLLGVLLLFFAKRQVFRRKVLWKIIGAGLAGVILSYALVRVAVVGHGLERGGVTLFSQVGFWDAVSNSAVQFGLHLLPDFLLNGATTTLRHGDGQWGVLLLPTFLMAIFSLIVLIPKWHLSSKSSIHILVLGAGWLLIGIIPAAIATEVPHSNRALLALPGFLILAVLAIDSICRKFSIELVKRIVIGIVLLAQSLFFVAYIHDYFTVFSAQSANDFKDGYIEAFQVARQYELGLNGKPQVEKIIFTTDYGQSYIYALLVRKTNPIYYQGGSLIKYEFRDVVLSDFNRSNALVVASDSDSIPNDQPTHSIYGSDGKVKFNIFLTPKLQ